MSAFCVYGMTASAAKVLAHQQFDRAWLKMSRAERKEFSADKQAAWIHARAEEILAEDSVRQVSPAFDAPQFAQDWIAVAVRTDKAKRCRVMARGIKRDKNGQPKISKATQKPMEGWVPYVGPM